MKTHMDLLQKIAFARKDETNPTVLLACDVAERKLREDGHLKTFADLSSGDFNEKRRSSAFDVVADYCSAREGKD